MLLWNLLDTHFPGTLMVLFAVQAGFSAHEAIHYHMLSKHTTPVLIFRGITPTKTNFEPSEVPNPRIRLSAITPTIIYSPILVIFLIKFGFPSLMATSLANYLHVSFLAMLVVASYPSRGDVRALINPNTN